MIAAGLPESRCSLRPIGDHQEAERWRGRADAERRVGYRLSRFRGCWLGEGDVIASSMSITVARANVADAVNLPATPIDRFQSIIFRGDHQHSNCFAHFVSPVFNCCELGLFASAVCISAHQLPCHEPLEAERHDRVRAQPQRLAMALRERVPVAAKLRLGVGEAVLDEAELPKVLALHAP